MKTKILLVLLFIPFLLGSTCSNDDENCHDRIVFINKTNKTLYVTGSDTILLSKYANNAYSDWYKTLPNESNNKGLWNMGSGRSYCWEKTLEDTLHVFIFDENALANHSWKDIVDNYMVLQRYDLSLQDLQKLDWTVTYPPTEAMKDMKMYPPYEGGIN